jgi:hypothetical protein
MPLVTVYHPEHFLISRQAKRYMSTAVRQQGVKHFGTKEKPLTDGDFTIFFWKVNNTDEMSHDVIIAFCLHAYPHRVRDADTNATSIAKNMALTLRSLVKQEVVTVGVSLEHVQMGWGVSTTPLPLLSSQS